MNAGRPLDIAIVGLACRFPGCARRRRVLGEPGRGSRSHGRRPPDRWDPAVFFDADATANDRVYCRRGGYLDGPIDFDPAAYGIMPLAVEGGEPEQFLVLDAARVALADAGLADGVPDGRRVEVVIGRGNYFNRGNLTRLQHGRIVAQTVAILRTLHPEWTDEVAEAVRADLKASLPPFGPETIPGQLTNATAGTGRGPARPGRRQLRRRCRERVVAGGARPRRAGPVRPPRRPGTGRGGLPRGRRRFPDGLPPAWRVVKVGPGAALRAGRRRDLAGRGGGRRGAQAAPGRRARRRPRLRGAQGGGAGQRRPGRAAWPRLVPRGTRGRSGGHTGGRASTRRRSGSSRGTAWACPPPTGPSCAPCGRSSRSRPEAVAPWGPSRH